MTLYWGGKGCADGNLACAVKLQRDGKGSVAFVMQSAWDCTEDTNRVKVVLEGNPVMRCATYSRSR